MTARRTGRRPGDPEITRRSILAAARAVFGRNGYERATMRAIGAEAGVDPGLIHHYFGTKQGLFAAAHEIPFDPSQAIRAIASGPESELGERLTRFYLTVVGAPDSPALSMIRAAASNETASQMLSEFIEDLLLTHAASLTSAANPRLRFALAAGHLIGIVFARNVIGVRDLAEPDLEVLVAAIAPTIQHYLTSPQVVVAAP